MFPFIVTSSKQVQATAAPNVPVVAKAMKNARAIVQYFNKSTQATNKLKDQQQESSLAKYIGKPKNILQDVKTRWWVKIVC